MLPLDKFVTEKHEPSKQLSIVEEWLQKNFTNERTKNCLRQGMIAFLRSVYGKEYANIKANSFEMNKGIERYLNEQRDFVNDLRQMARWLQSKGYAPKTINRYLSHAKVFFEEHGHEIPKKEWRIMRRRGLIPKADAITRDDILSKDQIRGVLSHLPINGKAIALFLLSTGLRISEALRLKVEDFNLNADPPEAHFRSSKTKKAVAPIIWTSYEARDAIKEWLKIKDTIQKPGGHGKFAKEMVFDITTYSFRSMWKRALKKTGLDQKDSETGFWVYHVHTLRKFFRTQMGEIAKVPDITVHAWMGHSAYLAKAYERPKELAQTYKKAMDAVTIYGGAGVSEFKDKLEAIEREVKEKDEELHKVNEMLDKLGIPNDRPLEERLLEYFKVTQTKQIGTTPQTVKTEPRPPTKPLSKPLIVKEQPKEVEKPKATGYSRFAAPKQKPSDYITCTKTKQAYTLEDLPCMVDVSLSCDNDMCKKQIMKLIA